MMIIDACIAIFDLGAAISRTFKYCFWLVALAGSAFSAFELLNFLTL